MVEFRMASGGKFIKTLVRGGHSLCRRAHVGLMLLNWHDIIKQNSCLQLSVI